MAPSDIPGLRLEIFQNNQSLQIHRAGGANSSGLLNRTTRRLMAEDLVVPHANTKYSFHVTFDPSFAHTLDCEAIKIEAVRDDHPGRLFTSSVRTDLLRATFTAGQLQYKKVIQKVVRFVNGQRMTASLETAALQRVEGPELTSDLLGTFTIRLFRVNKKRVLRTKTPSPRKLGRREPVNGDTINARQEPQRGISTRVHQRNGSACYTRLGKLKATSQQAQEPTELRPEDANDPSKTMYLTIDDIYLDKVRNNRVPIYERKFRFVDEDWVRANLDGAIPPRIPPPGEENMAEDTAVPSLSSGTPMDAPSKTLANSLPDTHPDTNTNVNNNADTLSPAVDEVPQGSIFGGSS